MIFDKQALLALGVACAASPFSRVGAVSVRGDEKKSPLNTFARKLDMVVKAENVMSITYYVKGSTLELNTPIKKESSSTGGEHSTSKGGKNPPNYSSKAHKESTSFFVASAACAQKCISANYPVDSHLLKDAIQQCDAASSRQMWDIVPVPDSTFVKVKNAGASGDSANGYCLGVVPQVARALGTKVDGDDDMTRVADGGYGYGSTNAIYQDRDADELLFPGDGYEYEDHDMCSNGSKLGLVSCDHPTSQWYSTDGQLISSYCLSIGLSSFLSVNEGCTDLHLSTTSDGATAISRKETFMAITQEFIKTIPPPVPTFSRTTANISRPTSPTTNPTLSPTLSPTLAPL